MALVAVRRKTAASSGRGSPFHSLGLHEQHFFWAHHGSPQAARPDNLSPRSRDASAGHNLGSVLMRLPPGLIGLRDQEQRHLQAHEAASALHVLCIKGASLSVSWPCVSRARAQGASLSTQSTSCSWAPCPLHLACRPNQSLKRDCQRRATRPAQPLVQSSASRAWRHTVGSRLAPTLGLTQQKLWASNTPSTFSHPTPVRSLSH